MPKFQQDITKYFSDILTRGRDITVRIAVEKGTNVNLSDESIEGDTYADWIIDYIKTHTVKGAYKMQRNTDKGTLLRKLPYQTHQRGWYAIRCLRLDTRSAEESA